MAVKEQATRRQEGPEQKTRSPQAENRSRAAEQIPLQVYARLLSGQTDLTQLSTSLLQELAETVGNSGLAEILQGSGSGIGTPALHMTEDPGTGVEPPANGIRTELPLLSAPAEWSGDSGSWPRSVSPGALLERGTDGSDAAW